MTISRDLAIKSLITVIIKFYSTLAFPWIGNAPNFFPKFLDGQDKLSNAKNEFFGPRMWFRVEIKQLRLKENFAGNIFTDEKLFMEKDVSS